MTSILKEKKKKKERKKKPQIFQVRLQICRVPSKKGSVVFAAVPDLRK